jgi:hypothetical protein
MLFSYVSGHQRISNNKKSREIDNDFDIAPRKPQHMS